MSRLLVLTVVLCLSARTAAAEPRGLAFEDAAAAAAFERASEAWAAGDYALAADELDRAWELEPVSELLYARGQARRLAGQCRIAMAHFEAYLRTEPPEPKRSQATTNLKRCRDKVGPVVTPPPPRITAPPASAAPSAAETPGRWVRDPWGWGFLGVGLGAGASGLGFLVAADVDGESAGSARSHGDFRAAHNRAFTRLRTGAVFVAVGSTLVTAAIVRFAVLAANQPARR